MPRRALADKRPFLLLGITAALVFYYLRGGDFPELYLVPVKGFATFMLAVYIWVRHSGPSARLLAWAFGAAALGDMALEADRTIGGLLFFAYHVMAMGVYLRHRRPQLAPTQSWVCGLVLLLTPVIAWMLPADRQLAWQTSLYGLALGAMVASAWASDFPRYRVGAGAMLVLLSDILIFAGMGALANNDIALYLVWPIYYLGQLLIATGVVQTMRKRDPELKLLRGG